MQNKNAGTLLPVNVHVWYSILLEKLCGFATADPFTLCCLLSRDVSRGYDLPAFLLMAICIHKERINRISI